MSVKRSGFNQYFIAIVPPQPIFEETFSLKNYFKDQYNSKASLNSPPHITLHMPFEWKAEKENQLISKLTDFIVGYQSFQIDLKNFNCFEPRVIFIDVGKSEALFHFQKALENFCKTSFQLFNAQYRDLPFHPHLTLAFRDLKKPAFHKAWEEFSKKNFERSFTADRIALLKHNGKKWEVFTEFFLA